jgi:predicted TPR repeat methyltransferase
VAVVEAVDGPDYVLRPTRRYAHPPAYMRSLARSVGWGERGYRRAFLRLEAGRPLEGDVYVFQRYLRSGRTDTPAGGE